MKNGKNKNRVIETKKRKAVKQNKDLEIVSGKSFDEMSGGIKQLADIMNSFSEASSAQEQAKKVTPVVTNQYAEQSIKIDDLLSQFDKDAFMQEFTAKRKSLSSDLLSLTAAALSAVSAIQDVNDILRHAVSDKSGIDTEKMTREAIKSMETKYVDIIASHMNVSEEVKIAILDKHVEKVWSRELPSPSVSLNVGDSTVTVDAKTGKTSNRISKNASDNGKRKDNRGSRPMGMARSPYGG